MAAVVLFVFNTHVVGTPNTQASPLHNDVGIKRLTRVSMNVSAIKHDMYSYPTSNLHRMTGALRAL